MAVSLLTVLGYTAVPVGAAFVGGLIATFWPPGPAACGAVQHVAAGVVFAAALGAGTPRWRIVGLPAGPALLEVAGGAIGYLALGRVSAAILAGVLAFGAVALMYLVTEDLLVEAHQVKETGWAVALFFVGFLAYLLIEEII